MATVTDAVVELRSALVVLRDRRDDLNSRLQVRLADLDAARADRDAVILAANDRVASALDDVASIRATKNEIVTRITTVLDAITLLQSM